MKIPKKYLTTNPGVMKREIKKHGGKADRDSSAYGPWDADYKSKKAGKGKPVKTSTSKYTKKFKELYDAEEQDFDGGIIGFDDFSSAAELAAYEVFIETGGQDLPDNLDESGSAAETGLKNKAKKTGMPFFPEVKKMLNQHHEMLITSSVLVGVIVFLALQAVPVVKDEMSEISSFLNNLNMNLMPPVDLKSGINK